MKFKAEEPRLPFPFNLIPYVLFGVWIAAMITAAVFIYLVIVNDPGPGDIGRFFGSIVRGFNETVGGPS